MNERMTSAAKYIVASVLLTLTGLKPLEAESLPQDAQRALLRGDWGEVLSVLEKSDIKNPDVPCRMVTAHACLASNKNNEHLALLLTVYGNTGGMRAWDVWTDEFLVTHSRSAVALYLRADAHARMGQLAEARQFCDQAIANDPAFSLAYNARAVLMADTGKTDAALEDLNSAVRLNPQFVDAHANMGVVYLLLGAVPHDGLAPGFDEALKRNPSFALAHNGRGVMLFAQGDFLGAAEEFSLANALLPALVVAEINREVSDSYAANAGKGLSDYVAMVTQHPGTTLSTFMQNWNPPPPPKSRRSETIPENPAQVPLAHVTLGTLDEMVNEYGLAAVREAAHDQLWQARSDTFKYGRQLQSEAASAARDARIASYFSVFDTASSLAKNIWDVTGCVGQGWQYAFKGTIPLTTTAGSEIIGAAGAGYETNAAVGAVSPFLSWYGGNAVNAAAGLSTTSPLGAAVMSIAGSSSMLGNRLFSDWSYVHSVQANTLMGRQIVRAQEAIVLDRYTKELDNRWMTETLRVRLDLSPEPAPLRLTLSSRSIGSVDAIADYLASRVRPGQKVLIAADPFGHQAQALKQYLAWKGVDSVVTWDPSAALASGRSIGSVVAMSVPETIRPLLSADRSARSLLTGEDNSRRPWIPWWPNGGGGGGAAVLPGFRDFSASTQHLLGSGSQPGGVALDFSRALVDKKGVWPVTTWFGLAYAPPPVAGKAQRQ
jgi:tetratricopeptide (TPR) repeat protein